MTLPPAGRNWAWLGWDGDFQEHGPGSKLEYVKLGPPNSGQQSTPITRGCLCRGDRPAKSEHLIRGPQRRWNLKSTDGGASWVTANSGLPATSANGRQNYVVTSLVIDPDHPGTLYANGDGVFRSTDGGATWSSVGTGLTTFFVYTLVIDPHDTRTVYAGTADGVFAITFSPDE